MQVMGGLRRLSGEELLPADLEMMMTYAYESIYRSAYIGEMVNLENCLWNFSGLLQWIMAGVSRDTALSLLSGNTKPSWGSFAIITLGGWTASFTGIHTKLASIREKAARWQ